MLGLVTATVAAALDPDLVPLRTALGERLGGDRVAVVAWDDPSVDWTAFDAVVLRSTWDYTDRLDEFLAWVGSTSQATTLINPADAVRWNADKRYLADLEGHEIPIVPTVFVEPGDPTPGVEGLHVVKPTVGAGSSGARRCEPDEVADHVSHLHGEGRTAMIQPYLDLLDEFGETALCFVSVDGRWRLSHAFAKAAILTGGDVEQEGDLFAKEQISARVPSDVALDLARAALRSAAVTRFDDLLYARVDVAPIRRDDGTESFVVMELELIEPSFFFGTDRSAADVFADAVVARHASMPSGRV